MAASRRAFCARSARRLSGQRGGGFAGVAFAVNTFLTERIEETIAGFPAPVVINLYGNNLDVLDRDAQAVAPRWRGCRERATCRCRRRRARRRS